MKPGDFFEVAPSDAPRAPPSLTELMRLRTFNEFVGQESVPAPGCPLCEATAINTLQSIVLWGPRGTRKTKKEHLLPEITNRR